MTRYDLLDARTQIEQKITEDLKRALEKRGFQVKHNGTDTSHAAGGLPDIEVWDDTVHINVEITKSVKSSSDREYLSIKDHLNKIKENNSRKKCFVWFVSPETHYRMINEIKEHNIARKDERDLKILPLSFYNFEIFIDKLITSTREQYTKEEILNLFHSYLDFVDDERIAIILQEKLFSSDLELKKELEKREENKHQKAIEDLIKDLKKLEQDLRDYRIALAGDAIKNVIYLVFMKLYDEKREREGKERRFTLTTFKKYQEVNDQEKKKKAVHLLFETIKKDLEIKMSKMLTDSDKLADRMDDDFVEEFFLKPFSKYHFYRTKIDGLGAAYEVLGKLSGKDVKVGQFFTPENVVRFMVKLAELQSDEVVLDPACGTGRFLIYSMDDMIQKAEGERNSKEKILNIKTKQLFGTDDDPNVSKLAKMNMYIHEDGKTNIFDRDGLLLNDFDGKVDAVLTNPPLGNLSYMLNTYDKDFREKRMDVIPKKNITEDKLKAFLTKIEELKTKQKQEPSNDYEKRIKNFEEKVAELRYLLRNGKAEFKISGNQMKGGALFTNAIFHCLKKVRDESELPEWRGGKLLIILDEAVLNTDDYSKVREFIKKHFYIKAIISLTTDTFVPVSNTTTKTSILYAIKKDDEDAVQQEPIFFAHAEKVGLNTRKRVCENKLFNGGNDIISKYMDFKKKVRDSYRGTRFDREEFKKMNFKSGTL